MEAHRDTQREILGLRQDPSLVKSNTEREARNGPQDADQEIATITRSDQDMDGFK